MDIIQIVKQAGGGAGFDKLARANGLEPVELQALLVTVLPAIAQRLEANTLSRGGVADVVGQMVRPEHAYLLEHPEASGQPWAAAAGVDVLDTIFFGDKAKSRALAARAASQTGIDQGLVQKLLPIIASILMGALGKGSQGGLQDILKRLPELAGGGGEPRQRRQPEREEPDRRGSPMDGLPGGLGDILSRIPGMPGAGNDGGLARPAGGRGGTSGRGTANDAPLGDGQQPDYGDGSPLPLPGARIPGVNAPSGPSGGPSGRTGDDGGWGDIFGQNPDGGTDRGPGRKPGPYDGLPDVIRRGDVKVDGDPLSNIIRGVLGSLLGFQSKGVFGWILRFLVMRWGWGILQSILRRSTGR